MCRFDLNEFKRYSDALNNSVILVEYSFVSTSKSQLIANMFNQPYLFSIISLTGTLVEQFAKYGIFSGQNEKEVLFKPNCGFRILDITKQGRKTLITMEEVI